MSLSAKTPRPPFGDGRTSINSFLKWVIVGAEGEGGGVTKEGEDGGKKVEDERDGEEEVEEEEKGEEEGVKVWGNRVFFGVSILASERNAASASI
jgi:hypothetical protein